jgi:hypothetical protein
VEFSCPLTESDPQLRGRLLDLEPPVAVEHGEGRLDANVPAAVLQRRPCDLAEQPTFVRFERVYDFKGDRLPVVYVVDLGVDERMGKLDDRGKFQPIPTLAGVRRESVAPFGAGLAGAPLHGHTRRYNRATSRNSTSAWRRGVSPAKGFRFPELPRA